MELLMEFLHTDIFLIILVSLNIILLISFIISIVSYKRTQKNYQSFMKKIGKGTDIGEMLKGYISKVEEVEKVNEEVKRYCEKIDRDLVKGIQKTGIVRYSAFEDVGSDLSFAIALLNGNNTGIVLNGIYSREMSNIYAKPVKEGKSPYTLSEEEKQALDRAINEKDIYEVRD